MSDERESGDMGTVAIAVGSVVACLAYAGSLALQDRFPAVGRILALDLGPSARPTYYLRVGLGLGAGAVASAVVALASWARQPCVGEDRLAWVVGLLLSGAAIVAVLYP